MCNIKKFLIDYIFNINNKIEKLKLHFKNNKKDLHSKKGLMLLISKRKKTLKYIKGKNIKHYNYIIKENKIRK